MGGSIKLDPKKFSEYEPEATLDGSEIVPIVKDGQNSAATVEKIRSSAVISVNGQAGAVELDTGDVPDTADKRYMTDAEKTKLSNTSGANTGDQDLSGLQPKDADLTTIAAIDTTQTGVLASDGSGWIRKSYNNIKAALGLTKADVGLDEADNTSDVDKPVSTPQQAALDLKADWHRTQRRPTGVNDSVLTIMAAGHGWTKQSANGTVTDDTVNFAKGSQSLKIVTAGNGTGDTINARSPVFAAVDYTNKCIRVCYEVDDRTKLNRTAIVLYTNGGTSKSFAWTFDHGTDLYPLAQQGQFVDISLSFADATKTNTPDITQITQASIQVSDTGSGGTGAATIRFNGLTAFPDGSALGPVISVNFDDGRGSQWTLGKPILDTLGIRASFNIIRNLIDTSGRLTLDQLHALHDLSRHEINAHADTLVNHDLKFDVLLATQGEAALVTEVTNLISWMYANDFGDGADLLVTPNGAYDAPTLAVLERYFSYIRSIYAHQGQYVETQPPSNPHAIRAISGISGFTNGISVVAAKAYIDKVIANNAWGILTFHDIVAGAATSTNQIAQADLLDILTYLVNSGVRIETIGDVMRGMDTKMSSKPYTDAQVATKPSLGSSLPLAASGTAAAAGVATTAAKSDHVHPRNYWEAADHNLLAWTYDPNQAINNTVVATAGTIYVTKIHIPKAISATNLLLQLNTLGSTLTANQCFAGLYQGGVLLGSTSDQSANWASPGTTGLKTMAISGGPVAVAAGDAYIAFYFNGTTGPTFARSGGVAAINAGLAAAVSRFGTADTGRTTSLPTNLATIAAFNIGWWGGIS